MTNKYDHYKSPSIWRKIEINPNTTYLIPTDVLNVADHVHIDQHNPNSDGYGGRTLSFKLEDGTIYEAKGPWHTSCTGLKKHTNGEIDLTYLHGTMVTIYSTKKATRTHKTYVNKEEGWVDRDFEYDDKDEIIYQETTPVLGPFMRGENIAHALVEATGQPVYLEVESYGGASSHTVHPGDKKHVMAVRNE